MNCIIHILLLLALLAVPLQAAVPVTGDLEIQQPVPLSALPATVQAFYLADTGRKLIRMRNDSTGAPLNSAYDPETDAQVSISTTTLVYPATVTGSLAFALAPEEPPSSPTP